MPQGRLEVLLIGAKGLDKSDFLGQGMTPEWNETFVFTIFDGVTDLGLKIMDKDTFPIDLDPLFKEGSLLAATYNVVKGGEYHGQIRVSLAFTPEERYGQRKATADGNSPRSNAENPRCLKTTSS